MPRMLALVPLLFAGVASADDLTIVDVEPPRHALTAPVQSSIVIEFDRAVDPATVTPDNIWAFARVTGTVAGDLLLADGNRAVILSPEQPFGAGELVMVIVSHDVRAIDGSPLRSAGYSYQFWTQAGEADIDLDQLTILSTQNAGEFDTRAYGGQAPDLNGDRYPDLAIVNEVTADVRVFMNRADGTGMFDDVLAETFPVNTQASPSEVGDFDHDGHTDMCVANFATHTISILLGDGDGTFQPQQQIGVGLNPYGITVLDADGDGDMDIVVANVTANNMSLLLNDGNGVFGAPIFFPAGGEAERTVAATDMNDDGIMDLVIGVEDSQRVVVRVGNGNGTWDQTASVYCGGSLRVLTFGDVNGDGNEDVLTANGLNNTAAVLFGNGDGTLQDAVIYPSDPFTGSVDVGDLDGDGDLDWGISNFLGDWVIMANDGNGNFSEVDRINAPQVASCMIMADFDGDSDLDIALIDEFEDTVTIMKNSGTVIPPPPASGDVNGDGQVDVNDILLVVNQWGSCINCSADVTNDNVVDVFDLLIVLADWSG